MKCICVPAVTTCLIAAAPWLLAGTSSRAGEIKPAKAARSEPAGAGEPEAVKIVLHPSPEPRPALRYQLLPGLLERQPGNAAVLYNKIAHYQRGDESSAQQRKFADWLAVPLADLPRDEMRTVFDQWKSVLDDLHLAARRSECDWQLPLKETDLFLMLLPEIQESRGYARLLAARARLEIAEGRYDDALLTLQTGFALAQHVGEGPTIINHLVGIAISQIMVSQLLELVQQPDAPNLYWALSSLPQPLIDLRPAVETEMHVLDLSYPDLGDLETNQYTAEHWRQVLNEFLARMRSWTWSGQDPGPYDPLRLTAGAIRGYPQAKRYLIEQGRSAPRVEAMSVAQVVLIYSIEHYQKLRDDTFKWLYLPYWQARDSMERAQQDLQQASRREIVPLASVLLPAVAQVRLVSVRNERSLAMLRVIEALRMFAAAHDGRLPERLDEVAQVPIPSDPLSGQPFSYRRDGDGAILDAPLLPGLDARNYGARFQIGVVPGEQP